MEVEGDGIRLLVHLDGGLRITGRTLSSAVAKPLG
ncbi:MAG: hypothetical protein K0R62_971 [Nonomuraea muscovyensis]|nr:hypothetical protein [Nonomuraea muscovyensis]